MTGGSDGTAQNTIVWPEHDKGTLLFDVHVGKEFDSLFLTMQGGVNYFRVRLFSL